MKTPKDYSANLSKKLITRDMLGDCIYSCNKRAKNARDKIRQYKRSNHSIFAYQEIEKYEEKKESYYLLKKKLLKYLKPMAIHIDQNDQKYLFYDFGYSFTFHSPIDNQEKYSNLPVIAIGTLTTSGKNIDNLISVQFVRKVIEMLETGDYYVADDLDQYIIYVS